MDTPILIVEDEIVVASDQEEILNEAGYTSTRIAHSPELANERLHDRVPELMLLDVNLNGHREGFDIANEWSDRTHILFLTAYSGKRIMRKARETGADGYLLKPVERRDLLSMVDQTVNDGSSQVNTVDRGGLF